MQPWLFIQDKLNKHIPVVLLYVLESQGSSPGRQGFKMAVASDGSMQGSIGGGIMEHKFVEMAKAVLADKSKATGMYRQVHDKTAAQQSGMICSGEQTIFVYELQSGDRQAINDLVASLRQQQNASLKISPAGLEFLAEMPEKNYSFLPINETDFELVEKTGFKNILHIVGGGHCALALSRLISGMDFYLQLYEEREGLNTVEQNVFVQEKQRLQSFKDLPAFIMPGDNVYVVIMTFGYRTDDLALRSLFYKDFKYLGVMGSQKKMEKMLQAYRQEKVQEDWLQKIHTPIGLPIRSQTPEEIAISIAAQIIAVKNGA